MWEQVEEAAPRAVAHLTTSIWLYPEIMLIGIMRRSFLAPPVLWGQTVRGGLKNLRKAPALVTEFQYLINAPTVYAEAELTEPRNQALLLFLGFKELSEEFERKLYTRSI